MYKILFLFVLLFALTAVTFAVKADKRTVHVSNRVITGSPILVLNN